MPKIIWCGNKSWDTDFPENTLPNNAKRIERPDNIFKSSLLYGILPLIFSYAIICIKWLPVHEVLHGVCYKKGQKVYIGICLKKFAAFAVCHEPISKRRFVIMSLMPILLGIIPLAIFLLSPPNAFLSGICIPMGIIGMLSPMPDYMDVHIICKQVPKGAFVHTQNDGFYWYK